MNSMTFAMPVGRALIALTLGGHAMAGYAQHAPHQGLTLVAPSGTTSPVLMEFDDRAHGEGGVSGDESTQRPVLADISTGGAHMRKAANASALGIATSHQNAVRRAVVANPCSESLSEATQRLTGDRERCGSEALAAPVARTIADDSHVATQVEGVNLSMQTGTAPPETAPIQEVAPDSPSIRSAQLAQASSSDLSPSTPIASKAGPGTAHAIPTLSQWGVLLLAAMLCAMGWRQQRHGRNT